MKKSELRNIIKEEIKSVLNEDSLSMVPEWPEKVQAYDRDVVFIKVEEFNNGNAKYNIVNTKTNKLLGSQHHGSLKQLEASANDFVLPLGGTQSSQF